MDCQIRCSHILLVVYFSIPFLLIFQIWLWIESTEQPNVFACEDRTIQIYSTTERYVCVVDYESLSPL